MGYAFEQQDWDSVSTPVGQRRPRSSPRPLVDAAPPLQTPSQDASSQAAAAAAAANANRTRAITPEELEALRLQNEERRRGLNQGISEDQSRQQERERGQAQIEALSDQFLHVADMYRQDFEPNDPLISLGLSPTERAFDRAAAGLTQQGFGAFRVPGSGNQSDRDAQLFADANALSSTAYDSSNEEVLNNLQGQINRRRQLYGLPDISWRPAATPDPNRVQPGESMGQVGTLPLGTGGGDSGHNELNNEGGLYVTAQDRSQGDQIASRATAIARRTGNPDAVSAYLRSVGRPPLDAGQSMTLNNWRRRYGRDARRMREFPGYSPTYIPTGRSDPNLTTGLANTGFGAGVIASGDAMTFGLLDNATADPERTRAGMELLREQHPWESMAGEMAGSIAPGTAFERAAGRIILGQGGMTAARGANGLRTIGEMAVRPAGNAAYGAAYGAGSADQNGGGFMDRLAGAGRGAAFSTIGGEVGDRAVAGAGRALTGVRNAGTRYLIDRGIPLTVGDIGAGGGIFGRGVSRVQNVMESVPWLGDAIRARRTDSREALNRAAFDEALSPIGGSTGGQIGEEGAQLARTAVSDAYSNALDNVRVTADQPFVRVMGRIIRQSGNLPPDLKAHFDTFVNNRVGHFMANGELSGRAFQALRQEIKQEIQAVSGQLGERGYAAALRNTEAALSGLVRRHSPEVRGALRSADQAFRRTRVLEGAVERGINNQQPGMFTPAQLGQSARSNATRYGGNAATPNRPFYQLQREAQKVLPSSLPNSGTADRSWVLQAFPAVVSGGLYQAGIIDPKTAALFGSLGLPYTRTGQQAFQKLLVSRPDIVRRAGEAVISGRRWGGRAGAGIPNPITDQTPSPTGR